MVVSFQGLLMLFNSQLGDSFEGVGVKRAGSAALRPPTFDGLVKAIRDSFVWKSGIIIRVSGVRVPPPLPFLSIQSMNCSVSKIVLRRFLRYTPLTHFLVGFQPLKTISFL